VFLTIGLFNPEITYADENVGIGTANPDSSAVLDISIEALTKPRGVLFPRMTQTQRDAILLPAKGLQIFNTTVSRIEMNSGTPTSPVWVSFLNYGQPSGGDWAITGNGGLNAANNFIGTTDAVALVFKTNNTERMRILTSGYVGIGTQTPLAMLSVGALSQFQVDSIGRVISNGLNLSSNTALLQMNGDAGTNGSVLVSSGTIATPRWSKTLDSLTINNFTSTNIRANNIRSTVVNADTIIGIDARITNINSTKINVNVINADTVRYKNLAGGIPFDSVKAGTNQNQLLTVGNGSILTPNGTGVINANRVDLTGNNAPLNTNGSGGAVNQVLTSTGSTTTPKWTDSLNMKHIQTQTLNVTDSATINKLTGNTATFTTTNTTTLNSTNINNANHINTRTINVQDTMRAGNVNITNNLTVQGNTTVNIIKGSKAEFDTLKVNTQLNVDSMFVNKLGGNNLTFVNGNTTNITNTTLKSDSIFSRTLRLGNLTNNRVLLSNNGVVSEANAMADGQLLIGNTSGAPTVASLTAGNNIVIQNGPGSISISSKLPGIDSGSADNQTLRWDNTAQRWVRNTNVLATSSGSVSVNAGLNLNGTTSPLQANGNGGNNGQILKSLGNGATPTWTNTLDTLDVTNLHSTTSSTTTLNSTTINNAGNITTNYINVIRKITGDSAVFNYLNVTNLKASIPFDSVKTGTNLNQTLTVGNGSSLVLSGTGTVESNKFKGAGSVSDSVDLGIETKGILPIAQGGTNSGTALNNNRIMVSNGGSIVEANAMADGQLLIGNTSGAPTVASLTAGNNIVIQNGPGSISISSKLPGVDSGNADSQTLRWDNTAQRWVRNTNVLATAAGNVSVNAGLNLNGANSPLQANGNGGNNGEVLLSTGNGTTPTWTTTVPSLTSTNLTSTNGTITNLTSTTGTITTLNSTTINNSGTITSDSVSARSGRFDNLYVTSLKASIPFDSVKTGTNLNQTLTV
ncbi:MAG: hypothetical protein JNJ85_01605, partial [Candidatus Kapabacteria bacterium]|nr:hypothetical protein [Candidatus Kapabacteria bacterium]